MSREEYKKSLQATYKQFTMKKSPGIWDSLMSEIMKLPHPEKEEAFVLWSAEIERPSREYKLRSDNRNEFETHA